MAQGPNLDALAGGPHRTVGEFPDPFAISQELDVRLLPSGTLGEDRPRTAALDDGGFVMVWGHSAGSPSVLAQRFHADGTANGGQILVAAEGYPADVTALPNAGFAVVYAMQSDSRLRVVVYDDGVTPSTTFPVADGGVAEQNPTIHLLTGGELLVTWAELGTPVGTATTGAIRAQRFDATTGAAIGGVIEITDSAHLVTTVAGAPPIVEDFLHSVIALPTGGFAATWTEGTDVRVRVFDASDSGGADIVLTVGAATTDSQPGIALLSDGRFVVVWESAGGTSNIYAQFFDANGTLSGSPIVQTLSIPSSEFDPSVSGLPDGGYVITWLGNNGLNGTEDVRVQYFNADGSARGNAFDATTTGFTSNPGAAAINENDLSVTTLSDGRVLTSWVNPDPDTVDPRPSGDDILFQIYDGATQSRIAYSSAGTLRVPVEFSLFDVADPLEVVVIEGPADFGLSPQVGRPDDGTYSIGLFLDPAYVVVRGETPEGDAFLDGVISDPTTTFLEILNVPLGTNFPFVVYAITESGKRSIPQSFFAVVGNDAPVIGTLPAGDLAYTEGAAAAVLPGVTVTDPNSTTFGAGSLNVRITTGAQPGDFLNLPIIDPAVGGLRIVNGGSVSWNGTGIGTFGTNGHELDFDFNDGTPVAALEALIREVNFVSEGAGGQRIVTFTLNDGDVAIDGVNPLGIATRTIDVTAVNDLPTLTTINSPIEAIVEDNTATITFSELLAAGDEADVDGTVVAFVVTNVDTGTLLIGADAGSATPWAAGSNDTIDATNSAFWTRAPAASGTQDAFGVVARDNSGANSATPRQVQIAIVVDPPPVLDLDGSAAGTGFTNTFVENGSAAAIADTDVSITDGDDTTLESATITLTNRQTGDLLAVNGVLAGAGAITAGSYNAGTGVLTLSGTASLALYQQALQQIVFSNTSEAPSIAPRSVSIVLSDTVSSGTAAFATINVTAVNDAPDNVVPASQTAFEEVAKVFSAGNGNQISVADADAGAADIRVSLSVQHGTLSLSGTSGLSFTTGDGTSDGSMTFTGSISGINSALNGLTYVGDADYSGLDTLAINTNDLGRSEGAGTGSELEALDGITIDVLPVNDAPAATLGTDPYSATEQQALDLKNSGMSVSDVDAAAGAILTVTLSVTDGTLEVTPGTSGATVTDSGTSSVTIRGTLAQIDALLNTDALSEVGYIFNDDAPPSSATLTLAVNDRGQTGTVIGAPVTFEPAVTYPAGTGPGSVAAADFDGDGTLDLVTTQNDPGQDQVLVRLGNGDGTFGSSTAFTAGPNATFVTTGDVDGDGDFDIVTANYGDNTVSVLRNNGDGTFAAATVLSPGVAGTPQGAFHVALGQVNDDVDSFVDIVVANREQGSFSVLHGNGDGTFQAAQVFSVGSAGIATTRLALGDFNGDGNADVAIVNEVEGGLPQGRIAIRLGDGAGGFGAVTKITAGDFPFDIEAADLNGDGRVDLVISNLGGDGITVRLGNGDGTFAAGVNYGAGIAAPDMVLADVNRDGRLDIVTANNDGAGNVSVLLGAGNGTFAGAVSFATGGANPFGVAVADFDGTGQLDFAAANVAGGTVGVRLDATNDLTAGDTATINITALNDGPTITGPASIAVDEDVATAVTGITFGDVDAGSASVTATFSVASGSLSAIGGAGVTVGGDADTLTLSGTIGDINTFINDGKLFFKTAANATADVTLNVSIDDGGNTGSGGAQTADLALELQVTAIDDAPHISVQADRPDIATANFPADNVSVLLASGTGTFTSAPHGLDGGLAPRDIAVADFNGDGRLDLVTANGAAVPGSFTVLLGNGRGGFTADERGNGGSITFASLAVGDVNGDGLVDVVAGDFTSDALTILLSDGNGGFNESFLDAFTVGVVVVPAVALGDLDGDGDLDIVNGTGDSVFIRLGNGDGTFEDPVTVATTGIGLEDLALGDVNGDGRLDIVTANQSSDTVSVLLGTGSGVAFTAFTVGTPADQPFAITTADMNADGRLDLVTANQVSNDVTVMLGDGLGGFSNTSYPAGAGALVPNDVAVADMDGDGDLDIVTANLASDDVSVLTNTGSGFTPGLPPATGPGPVAAVVGNFDNAHIVAEDTNLVFSVANNNAITISDDDAATAVVEISVGSGSLTLATGSGVTIVDGANGSGFVGFSGTLAQINAALNGLTYRGYPDYNGDDELHINVIGAGPTATTIVPITVTAVNDAPVFEPSGGRVLIDFGSAGCGCFGFRPGEEHATGLTFDANGNIIVVGDGGAFDDADVLAVRLDVNGRIDTTFGNGGKAQTDAAGGSGSNDFVDAVALQGDKILVVGATDAVDLDGDVLVVRYSADGTLDTTFATNGMAIVDFGSSDGEDDAEAIAVLGDGSFVVGGETNDVTEDFAIAKFTPNGALDTAFDADGLLTIDFGGGGDEITAIAVRGALIVAAGESQSALGDADFAIARFDAATGVLDTGFSGDGKLTIDFDIDTSDAFESSDRANDMAFQSDGTIVLVGRTDNDQVLGPDFAIARVSAGGTVLSKTQLDFGAGLADEALAVAVDASDRIVVGGSTEDPLSGRAVVALARFNADGTLDTTFGTNGRVVTDFGDFFHEAADLAIDAAGNIVITGGSTGILGGDFLVARYDEDGVLDPTFGVPRFREGSSAVVMQGAAIAFDADLEEFASYEGLTVTVQRTGGANADDVFLATGVLESISEPSGTLTLEIDDGSPFPPPPFDVGTYTQAGGVLTLTFDNGLLFPGMFQAVLRSIAYRNLSDAPPPQVSIEWKIEDNNTGDQGTGGALSTTVNTTVLIQAVNDAPTVSIAGTPDFAVTNVNGDDVTVVVSATSTALPAGGAPVAIAVGDVNGDAIPDLVTANFDDSNVSVFIGNGLGGFGAAMPFSTSGLGSPVALALGDLDSDGELDIVTAHASDDVGFLYGDGSGGFTPSAPLPLPAGEEDPTDVALADLNGDGNLDILTTNFDGEGLNVRLGNGDRTFGAASSYETGIGAASMAVADMDGDGRLDVVTANPGDDSVSILRGDGNGRFDEPMLLDIDGGLSPVDVAVGDVTGDGLLDIVTANQGSDDITLLAADGIGGYRSFAFASGGGSLAPGAVALVDIDGDSDLDLLVALAGSDEVVLHLNDGFGALLPVGAVPTGTAPLAIAVANFDNLRTVNEDEGLVFSAANSNAITVGDPDATSSSIQTVTLSAAHGNLTLASGSGVTVTGGADGSGSVTFTGTLAQLNDALEGLAYQGVANYFGADRLTVTINDGGNGGGAALTSTLEVPILVTSLNDAPAGLTQTITIDEDTPRTLTASDFFSDPDDAAAPDALASMTITSLPGNGTLSFDGVAITAAQLLPSGFVVTAVDLAANKLSFAPDLDDNGSGYASFDFIVTDDGATGGSHVNVDPTPDTLTFDVTAVNDAPVTVADSFDVAENRDATLDVLANDTDVDGNALSLDIATGPSHGSLTLSNGLVVYTPDADFSGADSFTYRADDGQSQNNLGNTVTVNLMVHRNHRWSELTGGSTVTPFNPEYNVLRFDDPAITAAQVSVVDGSFVASVGPKTVTFDMPFKSATPINVIFDNGSRLVIGDGGIGIADDDSANMLDGLPGADHLLGLGGDDTLNGLGGNDRLAGGTGNDTLLGGGGIDTAYFSGNRADYSIVHNGGFIEVSGGADGTDNLRKVEFLQFDDILVSSGERRTTDFNGDGRTDLILRDGNGNVQIWLMNGGQATPVNLSQTLPPDWLLLSAAGDYNGDGVTDLLWRNRNDGALQLWEMNGATVNQVTGPLAVPLAWHLANARGDYNGDGTSDILFRHTNGDVAMWLMQDSGIAASQIVGNKNPNWTIVDGATDFNGDGMSDILWRHTNGSADLWLMNGPAILDQTSVMNIARSWDLVTGRGDYNGDGQNDLLWSNRNGDVGMWLMNGTQFIAAGGVTTMPASWRIVDGTGDYNGDGMSDILWRHNEGEVQVWLMNGLQIASAASLGRAAPSWQIVDGHGDYNGDGMSDVMWRNSNGSTGVWLMDGASVADSGGVGSVPATLRVVSGHGDYNGDGKSDVLWRNGAGDVSLWLADAGTPDNDFDLATGDASFTVAETAGDFNADGKNDLLWRNSANGEVRLSLMDGATRTDTLFSGVPGSWGLITGAADYNADGRSDLLWRNTSGAVAMWQMNGDQIVQAAHVAQVATSWSLIDGLGDYNNDGKSDLLWRHSTGDIGIWLMDGSQALAAGGGGNLNTGFSLVSGHADFNNDGMSDLLWRNGTTGDTRLSIMNGFTATSTTFNVHPAWSAVGTGDYNGDGKSDILWRHTNGEVGVWLMDGGTASSAQGVGRADATWRVADAQGDYNNDGKSDVLWENASGDTEVWNMDGASVIGGIDPGWVNSSWQALVELTGELNPIV